MSQTVIEKQRALLDSMLRNIDGVKGVYYQPPSITRIQYPCIIYSLNDISSMYGDDRRYLSFPTYEIVLMDYDPESIIQKYIMDLDNGCYIRFNRYYTSDNLNHWVYELTFSKNLW